MVVLAFSLRNGRLLPTRQLSGAAGQNNQTGLLPAAARLAPRVPLSVIGTGSFAGSFARSSASPLSRRSRPRPLRPRRRCRAARRDGPRGVLEIRNSRSHRNACS